MSMAMDTASMKAAEEIRYEAEKESDQGRVHHEHGEMRATLERLDHQIGRLTERLVKVLQPESNAVDAPAPMMAVENKPVSPLAARLQEDTAHVGRLADQVSELMDRLEV